MNTSIDISSKIDNPIIVELLGEIDAEEAKLRDEYGRNAAGQRMLMARRLVEAAEVDSRIEQIDIAVIVGVAGGGQHARCGGKNDRRKNQTDHGTFPVWAS